MGKQTKVGAESHEANQSRTESHGKQTKVGAESNKEANRTGTRTRSHGRENKCNADD